MMNATTEPQLAPPGAGLPKLELMIARLLFNWQRRGATCDGVNITFQKHRDAIDALVKRSSPDNLARRVLIKRVIGIEDSSRYWSVLMTLEHLRIMNRMVAGVIKSLAKGEVPAGKASTANVKPSPDVTASVIPKYEESCIEIMATAKGIANLHTEARFLHPWFGPLDAAGWHFMSAMHMGIHRAQIRKICGGW